MSTTPDLSSLRISRDDDSGGRPGRGRSIVIIVLVLVLAAALAWVLIARPGSAIAVQSVIASATGGGSASSAGITANGYVVARTRASVSAKVLGRLATLHVHEGSYLKQGEIIATIEDADFRAQVAAARAAEAQIVVQITQAKRDLKRAEQLRQSQLNAEVDLEGAQTRLDAANAQLESAKAQTQIAEASLENTRVRAPFNGTVLRKDAEVGEIVAPSSAGGGLTRTAIVTMADLGTLEVEVDVNEAYIAQIRGGQGARITLDAYPDTSFSGRVRQVVPTADRQKATVQVKVSILDHDPRILPEMGAKVLFENETHGEMHLAPRRVLVPSSAVVQDGAGAHVWLIEKGRVTSRTVELGPTREDHVEVRSGLEGGESLVLEPPAGLRPGARVRAVERSSAATQGE
jgi:RND family efflux transporter MFP subunit